MMLASGDTETIRLLGSEGELQTVWAFQPMPSIR